MLLQIQINFMPQLHAVFVLYVTGVNTILISSLMNVTWEAITGKRKLLQFC